ncbi:phage head-tail connector protein [Loigolactobacillus coryniformis]|uniref:phage head-tail connector protein n=1 Tax=Loigolactobacillus coryniformis TaxID=1610 RepID=UPI003F241CFA
MAVGDDKTAQLAAMKRRLGADAADEELIADFYDEALQTVLDYTGRTTTQLNHSLLIAARRLAIVYYNQQADEGETQRVEGGVSRTFEIGIPGSIRSAIAPYRLGRTRRLS